MNSFQDAVQQGSLHAWFYIPTAILLGALHGLEPGHSKTMMAAFIIAIRGTISQAVLLGLCAAFSHSLVIWLLAVIALSYGSQWNVESTEPYFQLGSALIVFGLSVWMAWRTHKDVQAEATHGHSHGHEGDHDHGNDHHQHDEEKWIETGHGTSLKLEVFEEGIPPVFRVRAFRGKHASELPSPDSISIKTLRLDGTTQIFQFKTEEGFLESTTDIPEPHEFTATLHLGHGDHDHRYVIKFEEGPAHSHSHDAADEEYQDAHELAHATEIQKRFTGRQVTTGQIALFGLTGGLLPCPAALTIVLVCIQLKKFALGILMVLSFSAGLAFTLVAAGAVAAWGLRHAEKRFSGFGKIARKLPYLSSGILALMAVYLAIQGWSHLHNG